MISIILINKDEVAIRGNDPSGNFFFESMSYEEFMEDVKSVEEARNKLIEEGYHG